MLARHVRIWPDSDLQRVTSRITRVASDFDPYMTYSNWYPEPDIGPPGEKAGTAEPADIFR